MKKTRLTLVILLLFIFKTFGQEDIIVSHSRFMQKVNPSFFFFFNMNKTSRSKY